MFAKSLKTVLTASILASALTAVPVFAGEGGEGGGREAGISGVAGNQGRKNKNDFATLHNPDGTSVTVKRSAFGGLVVAKKDRKGRVVEKRRIRNKQKAFVTLHNPDGSTSTIQRGADGQVRITDRSPSGAVTGVRNVN